MVKCIQCSSFLGEAVVVCLICCAGQPADGENKIDNVDNSLTNSPSILALAVPIEDSEDSQDKEYEIERLAQRGDDCFKSGKAWLGAKDRTRARKNFQRAFKYYETILKLDPSNEKARDARSKCLFKMA